MAIKRVVKQAIQREFTDIIVVHEDHKKPSTKISTKDFFYFLDGIVLCHLPEGPTAYFKINSLQYTKQIKVKISKNYLYTVFVRMPENQLITIPN